MLHGFGGGVPGEASGLLVTLFDHARGEAGVVQDGGDGLVDALGGRGVDEQGGLAGDFRQRCGVRGDDGDAGGHGFKDGDAEALCKGGVDEDPGMAIKGC